jgi:hypothetical protein
VQKCIISVIHYVCVSSYSVTHVFAWSRYLSVHQAIIRPFWIPNVHSRFTRPRDWILSLLSRIPSIAYNPIILQLILSGNISFQFTRVYPKIVLPFKVSYQKFNFPCSEYLLRFIPTEISVVQLTYVFYINRHLPLNLENTLINLTSKKIKPYLICPYLTIFVPCIIFLTLFIPTGAQY